MRKKSKKRPGRPAATDDRVKFTTTLPKVVIYRLRSIGGGNASLGIIRCVEAHDNQPREQK